MAQTAAKNKSDFSSGPVWRHVLAQAIPLTIAQLVHLLYNVVDRVYIGHLGEEGSMALTGIGLCFPLVTLIAAFTALFGNGGLPHFSMARGAGDEARAGRILGNSFSLLFLSSLLLTLVCYVFRKPILFAFGASESSWIYADAYLKIYLAGTVFSMLGIGLNPYINAQGFPRIGMLSVILGAVVNLVLDPIFIFGFSMGVSGAALATVISQALSALWVLHFLCGKRCLVPLRRRAMKLSGRICAGILQMGSTSFVMQGTNCLVQVVCNATLQLFGGDLYVGVMTVTNSVREIFSLPVRGMDSGAQPVTSFNYGARKYDRARQSIRFNTCLGASYTMLAWLLVLLFPHFWIWLFTKDTVLLNAAVPALRLYFFGFVFMALQFSGQSAFQSLGDARHAIFFSLFRKAILVTPLTLLLPRLGLGVSGVFLAEPISNVIGGSACYLTMRLTAYRRLRRLEEEAHA